MSRLYPPRSPFQAIPWRVGCLKCEVNWLFCPVLDTHALAQLTAPIAARRSRRSWGFLNAKAVDEHGGGGGLASHGGNVSSGGLPFLLLAQFGGGRTIYFCLPNLGRPCRLAATADN